jgi:hypothetical protein
MPDDFNNVSKVLKCLYKVVAVGRGRQMVAMSIGAAEI